MTPPRSSGIPYMVAAALAFSVMSMLVKWAGDTMPTMQVVLARSIVVLAIAWALLRSRRIPEWGQRRYLLLVRGLLGFVALSCFYYAVIHLPLADATVIQYTNPVFTALLAGLILAERLRGLEVGLILLSLGGVVVMTRPTFLFGGEVAALDPLAAGVALTGALFSAAAYVTVRALGSTEEPLVVVFYFALVSAVFSLPMVVPEGVWPRGGEWLLLAGVGVSTYLGQVWLTEGLRRERAGRAMAVGYLQIVFAAGWGFFVFAEVPDRWTVAGAAVIVACTWGIGRLRSAPVRDETPAPAARGGAGGRHEREEGPSPG